jgi:hypothetical protein
LFFTSAPLWKTQTKKPELRMGNRCAARGELCGYRCTHVTHEFFGLALEPVQTLLEPMDAPY